MHAFRVWAPRPARVEVQVHGRNHPAVRADDGWWTATVAADEPGIDYGFILDGQGPFPDPRSAWQPQGVLGLSRRLDHTIFPWTDSQWQAPPLSSAIIYELHVGTFTEAGTFAAAIDKLDHLVALGVTHVELMPVNEFPGNRGWGYDGVDLYAPHHAYGGPDGLKRLVEACHARNLAVLLDVVYNHLGPSGNFLARYGPYFTDRYSTPWGEAVNFDGPANGEVRRFFCDNALMWLRDYHVDGLRLDAVHAICDASARTFLEQLAGEVKQLESELGRYFVVIAESDLNDPRILWPPERGGFGLTAQWGDDFHHSLHAVLTGERSGYYVDFGTLADLCKALKHGFVYDGRYSVHRGRPHGRKPEGIDGEHFLQTHDQVGNRAKGERSSRLMSPGRLKIGAALVLTSPFIPMLFHGEEWGASTPFLYFTDHPDPELARAVREGRQREFMTFGWKAEEIADPGAPETFERSKLKWSELVQPEHTELFQFHQNLIRLRATEPSLAAGRLDGVRTYHHEQDQWLVMERGPVSVICNLAANPQRIPLRPGNHRVLLTSEAITEIPRDGVKLSPDSVAILKLSD